MPTDQSSSLSDDPLLTERLRKAESDAESHGPATIEQLGRLARDQSADNRLLAIKIMEREIYADRSNSEYFAIGESLIEDEDNTCRWQALILVSEFIKERPEDIWRVVEKYGESKDDDMRAGVACVLLEHLLEHCKVEYQTRADVLSRESREFAETLRMC